MAVQEQVRGVARRPRAFVAVRGKDAASYLQRLLSNDVVALAAGESCEALLLTAKARVVATMTVLRRAEQDFLLATEPELAEALAGELVRFRFAARVTVEREEHETLLLLGTEPPAGTTALRSYDYGVPAWELLDAQPPAGEPPLGEQELERLRILARSPRFGREIDGRVLPAEAGLVERAVSLTKGCYPGQEPVARLHYRGHVNRELRVLRLETVELPPYGTEVVYADKPVGRVTSAVADGEAVLALAYVRTEVPATAVLTVGSTRARLH